MSEQVMTQAKPQKNVGASLVGARSQTNSVLQRQCACGQHTTAGGECEECRKKSEGTIQRAAISSTSTGGVPPIVHEVLSSPRRSLDAGTRAFMEPRFGHDFSGVRVHTDEKAAESAMAVNALAYTVGRNVVFGGGQYKPGTVEGKRLLAHELTHTIQQQSYQASTPQAKLEVNSPNDVFEKEAEKAALEITNGEGHVVASQKAQAKIQ